MSRTVGVSPEPTGAPRRPERLFDWISVIDRCSFSGLGVAPKTIRSIAIRFGLHADPDGSGCRPGAARLSVLTGYEYKTIKRVIAILDAFGFIVKTSGGVGRRGGRAYPANCYQLTIAEDLMDRMEVATPAQVESAAEKVREANRRKPFTGNQVPRKACGKRVTDEPITGNLDTRNRNAADPGPAGITGNAVPCNADIRGTSFPHYGERGSAVPTQDLPPTTTYPSDEDLRTAVTVTRARDHEQDQISSRGKAEAEQTTCHRHPAIRIGFGGCPVCRAQRRPS